MINYFTHPTLADIETVLALIHRTDMANFGEHDADLEDIQYDWQQTNLEQDVWLAWQNEKLVGYSAVINRGDGLQYDLYTEPGWHDDSLATQLLTLCEERGRIWAQKQKDKELFTARAYTVHSNERDNHVFQRAGFELIKYHFNYQIMLNGELPKPDWQAGVAVRSVGGDEDVRPVHQLVETAFARPGRTPRNFEDWQSAMQRPELYLPALWFLAEKGDELIGVALCFDYGGEGWVRQLAVAPQYQKRGIGKTLLHHLFQQFQQRGSQRVGLAVDGTNLNAMQFYEKVGMSRSRHYNELRKSL